MLSRPSAVIFDMDGLLVDTEPLHAQSYVQTYAEVGLELTCEQYRQAITLGGMSARNLYISRGGDPDKWVEVTRIKGERFRKLMEEGGRLMPGVLTLLELLRKEHIPTAIATSSGRRSLEIMMDQFDLRPYFDHYVTWQDVETEKPDPKAFLVAAERLGVRPEDCIVLEDSPRGVLAAHRAGMKSIAIPNSSTADGDFSLATLIVSSLEDVDLSTMRSLFTREALPDPSTPV